MLQGNTLSLSRLDNNFAEIKIDSQSGSVNKFNEETLGDLRSAIQHKIANNSSALRSPVPYMSSTISRGIHERKDNISVISC